jgi:hypothetical protein
MCLKILPYRLRNSYTSVGKNITIAEGIAEYLETKLGGFSVKKNKGEHVG